MSLYTRLREFLRCSPKFYNRARYDTCLVQQPDGTAVFARLQAIFTCKAEGRLWRAARVTLFKTVQHSHETGIGMRRVREDLEGAFIETDWIIRCVFLSPTFENDFPYDFFVNDLVDEGNSSDIYLRLNQLSNCI